MKKTKDSIDYNPMVEFNLRAAKLHDFFAQYEAIRQKHAPELEAIKEEFERLKREKAEHGFQGDDWMGEE